VGGVANIAGDRFGPERAELGELVRRATERAHLLAGFEQQLGDLSAGVSGGSHDSDHVVLLDVSVLAVHPAWAPQSGSAMTGRPRFMPIRPRPLEVQPTVSILRS
jgi:hypothetical protein